MVTYNKNSIKYLHSNINFFIDSSLSLDHIFDFFSTHFLIEKDKTSKKAIADIYITREDSAFSNINFEKGEDIYLRKSASDFFTIPAKRLTKHGIEYIKCTKTGTLLAFDTSNNQINISTQSTETEQDELVFIELIRDLILKNEENHGVVVLHATSAYKNGSASLIIGPKGAGKSTTLLELVSKLDYKFMSGDKTFLWIENDELCAAGWPDYPHLGLGTLSKYTEFIDKFDLSDKIESAKDNLWSTDHKMAIDPKFFKEVLPFIEQGLVSTVGSIIYPNLYPADKCEVENVAEHIDLMMPHIERIFTPNHQLWNHFVEPKNQAELTAMINDCLKKASQIPALVIKGSGILEKKQLEFEKGVTL